MCFQLFGFRVQAVEALKVFQVMKLAAETRTRAAEGLGFIILCFEDSRFGLTRFSGSHVVQVADKAPVLKSQLN